MNPDQKVAVVTGSSSGIGLETSLTLARNGFTTYATMRSLEKSSTLNTLAEKEKLAIKVVQLDVTENQSVNDAIQTIVSEAGRIDVLVNNAGYLLFGAFEDLSIEEIKSQFETNFFGAVRVMHAVLPTMRNQRNGMIVNMSSMGGRMSFPAESAYHGTKFALEGVSESLQYEVEQFGIKIILIEPGVIKSHFANNLKMASKSQKLDSPYAEMMGKLNAGFVSIRENASTPKEVASVILNAVTSENPKLRYIIGNDAVRTLEAKITLSDAEFGNLIKQQFLSQS